MKKVLLLIYIISISSFANVGDKGNGTDPYKIHAIDFPEPQKLANAITILEKKLSFSNLPTDLKEEVISEAEFLENNGLIKYLGKIVIMSEANEAYGHRVPSEEGVFLGLGGFTLPKKGAQVYFTDRVKSYTVDEFGKNILHEVLHHTLTTFLKDDELYVERLTDEIWSGIVSEIVLKSLEIGYYLPKEDLSKKRILRAFSLVYLRYPHLASYSHNFSFLDSCKDIPKNELIVQCFKWLEEKSIDLPEDLSDYGIISFGATKKLTSLSFVGVNARVVIYPLLEIALEDQGYTLVEESKRYCIKSSGFFIFSECQIERKIQDLIVNKEGN